MNPEATRKAVTREQRKLLQERLRTARGKWSLFRVKDKATPAEVKKAQAICRAWEESRQAEADARREKVNEASKVVEEAIWFGDPDKALAALKRFEAMRF